MNIKIYDNGGKTFDRYTIYLLDEQICITTNGEPRDFWQHCEYVDEAIGDNESEISLLKLPLPARQQLFNELKEGAIV